MKQVMLSTIPTLGENYRACHRLERDISLCSVQIIVYSLQRQQIRKIYVPKISLRKQVPSFTRTPWL